MSSRISALLAVHLSLVVSDQQLDSMLYSACGHRAPFDTVGVHCSPIHGRSHRMRFRSGEAIVLHASQ